MIKGYNITLGKFGEEAASEYLRKKHYKILSRNYKNKFGEIDIIAEKKKEITFVEVKTRQSDKFGKPYEAVNPAKQNKIIRCAKFYLHINSLYERNVHFDVIEVYASLNDGFIHLETINHISDAMDQISQF